MVEAVAVGLVVADLLRVRHLAVGLVVADLLRVRHHLLLRGRPKHVIQARRSSAIRRPPSP